MARALQVLRKALPDGPTVPSVEALGRWLEEFHHAPLVELDYLGLVDLCAESTLRNDDSAGDVAEARAALPRGETKLARSLYRVTDQVANRIRCGVVELTRAGRFATDRERITRAGR